MCLELEGYWGYPLSAKGCSMFDLSAASTLPEMVSNGQDGLVFPAGNSQQHA